MSHTRPPVPRFFAAGEPILGDLLVWACASTRRKAVQQATRLATEWHQGERVDCFDVVPATQEMIDTCAKGETWYGPNPISAAE